MLKLNMEVLLSVHFGLISSKLKKDFRKYEFLFLI